MLTALGGDLVGVHRGRNFYLDANGNGSTIACPNHFFRDWFSEHHLETLNLAGSTYFGEDVAFESPLPEDFAGLLRALEADAAS